MNTKVYVEGGGNTKILRRLCRRGFREFFSKAGLGRRMPRIVASSSRNDAFSDFCTALKNAVDGDFTVLLVDAEEPVEGENSAWNHLARRDSWPRPQGANLEKAHLMVQCMEAWFLADKEALAEFFGHGFNQNALPQNPDIENIQKNDVIEGLESATKQCNKKGKYSKGALSLQILEKIDPDKVFQASRHAQFLIQAVKR